MRRMDLSRRNQSCGDAVKIGTLAQIVPCDHGVLPFVVPPGCSSYEFVSHELRPGDFVIILDKMTSQDRKWIRILGSRCIGWIYYDVVFEVDL